MRFLLPALCLGALLSPLGAHAAPQLLDKVVAMPDVRKSLTDMGLTVGYMSPQQLDKRERAYTQVWSRIIKDSGFQPQ